MNNFINDTSLFQVAINNLRPGLVKYMEDSYASIQWRTEDIPSEVEVLDEVARVRVAAFMEYLRSERDALLVASDWTQASDVPVDTTAWAEYRQALRDLPANTIDPENPVWPTPPNN